MSTSSTPRTYFGIIALIVAVLSVFALAANIGSSYLRISPGTFSQINNITALFYCSLTPLAFILGVVGSRKKSDSKPLSIAAMVVSLVPYLVLFVKFVYSLIFYN
ncbi:MAG: hypothetical protein IPL71_13975 [Anaerolineales bacterium]|uniref:hypothetical protein n=1 Tax=Candidatus Villigracilis proximus TaxID=3140683 RepID=UPI0031369601|nr:hypothetical protein [Anaerolineales bacterium]